MGIMNYPKVLYQYPDRSGESFLPSNGTEGMVFMENFCENCIHENPNPDAEPKCNIIFEAMSGERPIEWIFNHDGWPICTSFQKWDWDNDGDPNDPDNPLAPLPDNEFQLLIPFSVFELLGIEGQGVVETKRGIFEVANHI